MAVRLRNDQSFQPWKLVWGVHDGLNMDVNMGIAKIIVQVDSVVVYQAITQVLDEVNSGKAWLSSIKSTMRKFVEVKFKHIYWEFGRLIALQIIQQI
ncbi:hypothetical protein RJT34_00785 [Clitoria ternatea]|uniref:RNase H type-1 domain-containing protein n=1 Tax=Clitoria ternatea TaxID=43366 RepID=A0AAN9KH39_CLITE